jgi:outer membrane protein assembly factor BamB
MPRFLLSLPFALALSLALRAADDDWPQFLGPNRDNTSPVKVEPWKAMPAPPLVWKQPVGDAHSSPVVAGGVVYAFYQPKGKNADALAAFDAATGKPLWEKSYERSEFNPPFGKGPRATPSISAGKVYTLGNTGILACWDAKTGDIIWKVDTLADFHAKNLFFGISTSPLVEGNAVVIMVGGKGAGVVAFDKANGKVLWKATDDPASYASPIATGSGDGRQLVFLTGSHLRGLSPAGKELWEYRFEAKVGQKQLIEASTTPVRVGDVVVGSSVTDGSVGLRLTPGGKAEEAWRNPVLTCYFSTPVVVGEYLYMVNGRATIANPSITLRCVEAKTGKVAWERPKVGKYHAALIRTGNNRLLMLDDDGHLILLDPDPKEYKELARVKVCGPTWAHPALVGGKVYLRDEKDLLCIPLAG